MTARVRRMEAPGQPLLGQHAIVTGAGRGIGAAGSAAARAELEAFNPQGRLVQPEEVAQALGWLCLPTSGAIAGQAIVVAGGEMT